jgi:hypothetical protein
LGFDAVDVTASAYQNDAVRTTVTLDPDVYEAALHLSRLSGRRLGKVLSELARWGLAPQLRGSARKKGRFPVVDLPPNPPIIPASRVQQVIDEEGYF